MRQPLSQRRGRASQRNRGRTEQGRIGGSRIASQGKAGMEKAANEDKARTERGGSGAQTKTEHGPSEDGQRGEIWHDLQKEGGTGEGRYKDAIGSLSKRSYED